MGDKLGKAVGERDRVVVPVFNGVVISNSQQDLIRLQATIKNGKAVNGL